MMCIAVALSIALLAALTLVVNLEMILEGNIALPDHCNLPEGHSLVFVEPDYG